MSFRSALALGLVAALTTSLGCGSDASDGPGTDAGPSTPDAGDLCADADCSSLDDACGVGECDPTVGCQRVPRMDGTRCDDGDACTTGDACAEGACVGGEGVDCSDLDGACSVGVCDPADGCVVDPVEDGTGCDDGDACTDADGCLDGVCVGEAVDCSGLGDACNAGACDPLTGDCVTAPVMDGTPCDDGLVCTGDGVCDAGVCVEGDPIDCSGVAGTCGVGSCDEETGECVVEPAMEGASCDDGFACTTDDACEGGGCIGDPSECGGALYVEGFESGAGGWTTGSDGTTPSSWEVGTPANDFIDAAASGTEAWVTSLAGDYANDEESWIESPSFDFSGLADDPVLRFRHIFDIEPSSGSFRYDGCFVQVSTDGGATWTKIGTASSASGVNWYNDDVNQWWDDRSGAAGTWRLASHVLDDTAGFTDVRIRIAFETDGSVTYEGVGVDDVQILLDTNDDLAVGAVTPPAPGCGAVTSGPITVTIRNFGGVAVSGFDVSYTDPDDVTVTETVSTSIPAYGSLDYAFRSSLTVSTTTVYAVEVDATGDPVDSNDRGLVTVDPGLDIGTVALGTGYEEGFETDAGDWVTAATGSSWARGEPAGTFIDDAAEGDFAWVTNPDGDYDDDELSYLTTDFCFDFSDETTDPDLSFQHLFRTESCCDEGWVEVSTDAGVTWTKLGTSATGTNWYNDTSDDWWSGTSDVDGNWRLASHPLTDTAGEASVRIRFVFSSDFSVTDEGFGVDDIAIDPAP